MIKRILLPIDYTPVSQKLIPLANEWATRVGAELYLLHVTVPHYPLPSLNKKSLQQRNAYTTLSTFMTPFSITAKHFLLNRQGDPYAEILRMNDEIKADLIILGGHSHTVAERLFLGSNTDYVLHNADCPVFVYKESKTPVDKIIVPLDYTDINKEVVAIADEEAQRTKSELYFIHVVPLQATTLWDPGMLGEVISTEDTLPLTRILNDFVQALKVKARYQCLLEYGKPAAEILDLQRQTKARIIMMASHSHTMLNRLIMGSTTDYLLHHVDCSMYVYKTKK